MSRIAAGVAIALCLLVVPVLSARDGGAPRQPLPAANCTGPVPPGGEINRCNALRAQGELSRP
jgi:hypothetical protein